MSKENNEKFDKFLELRDRLSTLKRLGCMVWGTDMFAGPSMNCPISRYCYNFDEGFSMKIYSIYNLLDKGEYNKASKILSDAEEYVYNCPLLKAIKT